MKNSFMISVITPFYNGNKYIKHLFNVLENNYKTLKSKYPNAGLELIIVNDSPDVFIDLSDIKVSFAYRIVKHKMNFGIQQARITGLDNCSGDYVLFLDQDDELMGDAIASQAEVIIKNDADMVICNAYMERADGSSYLSYKSRTDYSRINDLGFYLKSHNVIKSPGQCLIKTNCIPIEWKKYIMKKNGSDDLFLWILMLEKSYRFRINKKPLYIHKYTGENLSESEEKMNSSSLEIVDFLKKIEYVPKRHVILLKRSREFSSRLRNDSILRKFKPIITNMDLFLYLVFNKIKRAIY